MTTTNTNWEEEYKHLFSRVKLQRDDAVIDSAYAQARSEVTRKRIKENPNAFDMGMLTEELFMVKMEYGRAGVLNRILGLTEEDLKSDFSSYVKEAREAYSE